MITAVDTNILLDVLIPGADGMKTRLRARKLCEDGMPCQSASGFCLPGCGALCVHRLCSTISVKCRAGYVNSYER